ncbi:unnamed protein product [Moneuplotes crassus]|uniref:START domain-containing protein n=1 Tax=Euplotes crassus TaxID=5936 RepID=A0AAD1UI28_EUPCR|nr:unnamed protein product [Moneuplotes crassus]
MVYPVLIANNTIIEGQSKYEPNAIKNNLEEIYKLIDKSDIIDREETKESYTKQTSLIPSHRDTISYSRNSSTLAPQEPIERMSFQPLMQGKNNLTMRSLFSTNLLDRYPEVFNQENLNSKFSDVYDIPNFLKNEYEQGIKINKEYILDLVEKLQDTDEDEQWEIFEKDQDNCTCWLSKSGSHLTSKLPLLHCELNFPKKIEIEKVLKSVMDVDSRLQWDTEITKMYSNQIFQDSSIVYTKYKNYKLLGEMDSVDKQLFFEAESESGAPISVLYSSFLPNKIIPKVRGHNRLKIIFSVTIFEKLEDGSTCMQNYCQFDAGPRLRLQYCSPMILEFLMKKPRNWGNRLKKFCSKESSKRRVFKKKKTKIPNFL